MNIIQYIKLTRPLNLFLIGLSFVVVHVIILNHSETNQNSILNKTHLLQHYLSGLALIISAAAGYVINDIQDLKIDVLNKPNKVIVGKHIKIKQAYTYYLSLVTLSVIFSIFISVFSESIFPILFIIIINLLLLIYSLILKKVFLIGNMLVSGILCSPVALSWFVLENYSSYQLADFTYYLLLLSVSIFLINLSREIIKDIEDIKGDAYANSKSVAIVLGIFWAKLLAILLIIILICILFFTLQNILTLIAIIPLIVSAVIILLTKNYKSYSIASMLLKVSMFAGMITFCLI